MCENSNINDNINDSSEHSEFQTESEISENTAPEFETTVYAESENPEEIVEEGAKAFNLRKEVIEWVYTILIALAVVIVVKGFFFDMVKVDGESMLPNLQHGDRLIVRKIFYSPQQGDIVILDSGYKTRNPDYKSDDYHYSFVSKFIDCFTAKLYVKRVIALPGQTVDIKDGKVYVDDKLLDEPYIDEVTFPTDPTVDYPITVEEDHVFVLGDNRNNSSDSRASSLGQVPYDAILGEAIFRLFPFNSIGTV